ncbi:MAG: hypothetical protein AAF141_03275 [Pseudomonadota bacterium]
MVSHPLKKLPILTTLSAGLMAATALPAFAADAGDAFARYQAVVEEAGLELLYDTPTVNGSSGQATNARLVIKDADIGTVEVPVGTIELSGVDDGEDGAIFIGEMRVDGINYSADDVEVTTGTILATDFEIPAEGSNVPSGMNAYGSISVDGATVSVGGNEIVTIASMQGSATGKFPDEELAQDFTITDIAFNVDDLPASNNAKPALQAMGYETVNMDMIIEGGWKPSGEVTLDRYDIIADDIGTLSLVMNLQGYTAELAKRIAEINAAMTPENQGQQSMAMMGEMANLALASGQISFTDNSITEKVLAFMAPQMGTDPAGLKAQAKGLLPLALSQLGNPELTAMVSSAVGTFLDNPGTLTVDIAPDAPVPFGEVMGAGMAAPQTLPEVLGVKVSAN